MTQPEEQTVLDQQENKVIIKKTKEKRFTSKQAYEDWYDKPKARYDQAVLYR